MKKASFLAAVMTVALGLTPMAAVADDGYGIINDTGMDITHLYISAHEEDEWGDDILGVEVLEDGDECGIEFDPSDDRCDWDIKITDGNGKNWTVTKVDLCKITKITFKTQGNKMVWSGN
jgi:hypothetical protein